MEPKNSSYFSLCEPDPKGIKMPCIVMGVIMELPILLNGANEYGENMCVLNYTIHSGIFQ